MKITGELIGKQGLEKVKVKLPVGSFYSTFNETFYPVVNGRFSIELNVTTAVFVEIKAGYRRFFVIVSPGDDIKVKIFDTTDKYKSLMFEGDNAAGQYWYNIYNEEPLATRISHNELFGAITQKNKDEGLKKLGLFFGRQNQPLKVLYKQGRIDADFFSLVKTDIRSEHVMYIIQSLKKLQTQIVDKGTIADYQVYINALLAFGGPKRIENTRCGFGPLYLMEYYSKLGEDRGLKNSNVWGVYGAYNLAPDSIKKFLLGNALLFSKIIGSGEFEYHKAFKRYKNEYPKSPYVTFLNSIKPSFADAVVESNIKLDTITRYNTFEELRQHFKGKAIYIDLWATWCMPCRAEFPYYPRIKADLKLKNLTSVFISIDSPGAKRMWKDLINRNHLEGYHILVNKNLMDDIVKTVYKNGEVSIPRYILIDKNGRIINWNAPRPSDPILRNVLSKL